MIMINVIENPPMTICQAILMTWSHKNRYFINDQSILIDLSNIKSRCRFIVSIIENLSANVQLDLTKQMTKSIIYQSISHQSIEYFAKTVP